MKSLETVLVVLGLILVATSIGMLASDPPKIRTGINVITVPYTSCKLLPPGNHTYRTTVNLGNAYETLELPRGEVTFNFSKANLGENCTISRLLVAVGGKASLPAVNNTVIKLYFYEITDNESKPLKGSPVIIPLNAKNLTWKSPTPVTATCTAAGNCEVTQTGSNIQFYYVIPARIDNTTLEASVQRPAPNKLLLSVRVDSIELPANASGLKIMVESNITGNIGLSLGARGECVYHYYTNAPTYIPEHRIYQNTIYYNYLDPGSLASALEAGLTGIALLLLALILRLR